MTRRLPGLPGPVVGRHVALLDIERVPLPAAADMLALTIATERRTGPQLDRELALFCGRLREPGANPQMSSAAALAVLDGLAQLDTSGGLSRDAAAHAVDLVDIALVGEVDVVAARLARLVLDGPDQLTAAIGDKVRAHVLTGALDTTRLAALWWFDTAPPWREEAVAAGRDSLLSALALELAKAARGDDAMRIAARWPPTRTPLHGLVAALAAVDQLAKLEPLLDVYRPGGELRAALFRALLDAADALAPGPQLDLAAHMLRELLAGGSPNPRDLARAMTLLDALDPLGSFIGRARQLVQAVAAWTSADSVRRLRADIDKLRAAADAAGEPSLADQLVQAIRTSTDSPALLAALRGA